jgi:hypothetical protein
MGMFREMGKQDFKTNIEIVSAVFPTFKVLTDRYGMKAAVSAGIVLLNEMEPELRENLIDMMNGNKPMSDLLTQELDKAVSDAAAAAANQAAPKQKRGH